MCISLLSLYPSWLDKAGSEEEVSVCSYLYCVVQRPPPPPSFTHTYTHAPPPPHPSPPPPLISYFLLSLTAVLSLFHSVSPFFLPLSLPLSLPPSLPPGGPGLSLQDCHQGPQDSPRCTRSNVRPTTRSWRDTETAQIGQCRSKELIHRRCIMDLNIGRLTVHHRV